MKITKFTLLLIVLAFVGLGFKCGDKGLSDAIKQAAKGPPGSVVISRDKQQTTPKGVKHFGKVELSSDQLDLIDAGLDAMFAGAKEDGFFVFKPHSFFEVFTPTFPCQPSPEQRVPSFLTSGGDFYDGTGFDQYNTKGKLSSPQPTNDGTGRILYYRRDNISVVFAAELILSIGTPGSTFPVGQMFVCPDSSILLNAARHGSDHIELANTPYTAEFNTNERYRDGYTYFNCSLYHGEAGVGHPLLPRNDRCLAPELKALPLNALPDSIEIPISPEIKEFARSKGVELNDNDVIRTAVSFRVVN